MSDWFLRGDHGVVPTNYATLAIALLLAVAVYTILGGMLSVLVTDFLQFVVMSAGLIVVTVLIIGKVGWGAIIKAVETHHGAGGFNPFLNPSLGWEFVLFNTLVMVAEVLTWQTTIVRVLSAKDTKTGLSIYKGTSFFFVCRFMIPGIWGIAALAGMAAAAGLSASVLISSRRHSPAAGRVVMAWLVLALASASAIKFPFPQAPYGSIQAFFNMAHAALLGYETMTCAVIVALLIYRLERSTRRYCFRQSRPSP